MGFNNKYPYTDFHELNLDWFLAEFKKVTDKVTTLDATVKQFTEFVTNYFNNLDVQEEINNKLDQMAADGTLSALIQPLFDEFTTDVTDEMTRQDARIVVLEGRMDTFASLPAGSTSGNAELLDIRVEVNGSTAASAGDAVREQVNNSLAKTTALTSDIREQWILDHTVDASGDYVASTTYAVTKMIACQGGNIIKRLVPAKDINDNDLSFRVAEYDASGTFIQRTSLTFNGELVLDDDTRFIRLNYGRLAGTGIHVTNADLERYYKAYIYTNMAPDIYTLSSRGNIIQNGYTSCEECAMPGYYTFYSGDTSSITDLPEDITGGGMLITYYDAQQDKYWQQIITTTENYVRYNLDGVFYKLSAPVAKNDMFISRGRIVGDGYVNCAGCTLPGYYTFNTAESRTISDLPPKLESGGFLVTYYDRVSGRTYQMVQTTSATYVRYSTSGSWFTEDKMIRLSYLNTAGDDNSTEQIYIDVPTGNRWTRYKMGHCVDADKNADIWRIMYVATVDTEGNETVITRKGEFECAVHLADRADFSGGVVHGDEVGLKFNIIADGREITKENANGLFNEVKIVRSSNLYDPDDSTTIIALHGVEYTFNSKLKIKQSLKWLIAETLTDCYLAMYPVLKSYSTYRYDDTSFDVIANAGNIPANLPDAKEVTEYGGNRSSTLTLHKYPEGLPGGDQASVTDNGGLNYNKIYFDVCHSGSSTVNELWLSDVDYDIR